MPEILIHFAEPVAFRIKVERRTGRRPAVQNASAHERRGSSPPFVGETRAVGVDRLGFAPTAVNLPQQVGDFWWFYGGSSVTNKPSLPSTEADDTEGDRGPGSMRRLE